MNKHDIMREKVSFWSRTARQDMRQYINEAEATEKAYEQLQRDVKEVYIIMSSSGGINLDISTGQGTCYTDLDLAQKALDSKNKWSANKGYGVYEMITLKVVGGKEE